MIYGHGSWFGNMSMVIGAKLIQGQGLKFRYSKGVLRTKLNVQENRFMVVAPGLVIGLLSGALRRSH